MSRKIKVGDKVRYVGEYSYDDLEIGDEKVVADVAKVRDFVCLSLRGVNGYISSDQLELVESADEKYTLEEVYDAISSFKGIYALPSIKKVKGELIRRADPEYLNYIELKKKVEGDYF